MADEFRFDVRMRVDQVVTAQQAGLPRVSDVPDRLRWLIAEALLRLPDVDIESVQVTTVRQEIRG